MKLKFLDHDQVNERLGPRSREQRWRDIRDDAFPAPIKDGTQNRWPDGEIESWARWRIAVRDGTTKITRWSEWWKADRAAAESIQVTV
jgi:predicted DNA-binding transcriptional regulator AlpA